jgi:hypothetical protein
VLFLKTHVVMRFLPFTRHATHATEDFGKKKTIYYVLLLKNDSISSVKITRSFKKDCVVVGSKLFQPEVGFCCCGVSISGSDSAFLHCSTTVIP